MKTTYIYGIRCLEINKYIYIGKSNNPRHRYGRLENAHNNCIQKFAQGYGEDNFRIEELEIVKFKTLEEWVDREKFWKLKLEQEGHPLCNKNDGGGGPTEVSEEVRAKIRKGVSKSWTLEKRKEQSKSFSGEGNPMYGPSSEEARNKIIESWTPERRKDQSRKMSGENHPLYGKTGKDHPRFGKHHTEEWKREQSKRMSGEGNPMYGKPQTEESNRKRSETVKEWHKIHGKPTAKPYPALYNVKTEEFILAGRNLAKLCREQNLSYDVMWALTRRHTKQTRDGWRLAMKNESELH